MKTSKEHDNRFTKDVLLHQIFQEIVDENKENSHRTVINDLIASPKKISSKQSTFLKWVFIIIFLTGIVYLWFYTITEVTPDNEMPTKSESYTTPIADQAIEQEKMTETSEIVKTETQNTYTAKKTDSIQLILEAPPELEDPRTEREKAKDALFKQMQN